MVRYGWIGGLLKAGKFHRGLEPNLIGEGMYCIHNHADWRKSGDKALLGNIEVSNMRQVWISGLDLSIILS